MDTWCFFLEDETPEAGFGSDLRRSNPKVTHLISYEVIAIMRSEVYTACGESALQYARFADPAKEAVCGICEAVFRGEQEVIPPR